MPASKGQSTPSKPRAVRGAKRRSRSIRRPPFPLRDTERRWRRKSKSPDSSPVRARKMMTKIPRELQRTLLRKLRLREKGDCASRTRAAEGTAPPIRETMAATCEPLSRPPSASRTRLRRPRKNSAGLRRWHASCLLNLPATLLAKLRPNPNWTLTLFQQSANCQTGQPAPGPNHKRQQRPSPARTIRGEEWILRKPSTAAPTEMRDGIPSASAEVPRVGRPRATPGIAPETDCPPECHSAPSAQSG